MSPLVPLTRDPRAACSVLFNQLVFIPVDFAVAWVAGLAVRTRAEQAEVAESRATQAEHAVFRGTRANRAGAA